MEDERQRLLTEILTVDRKFARALQSGRPDVWTEVDLTMPQLKVLICVAHGEGITMTQLARMTGMTLSTATGIVDRLVAQGYLGRDDDPQDRRRVLLRPTAEGCALLERLLEASRAHFRIILDRLSLDDLRVVARAFDLLAEAAIGSAEGLSAE